MKARHSGIGMDTAVTAPSVRRSPPARIGPGRGFVAALVLAVLHGTGIAGTSSVVTANGSQQDATRARVEYGVELALRGETERAESVFVAVLGSAPRDARALTNLGNLALLGGDQDVALAYYDRALRADPADPGIRLDRATALHLQGDTKAAEAEAASAVRAAGGLTAAAELLGLRGVGPPDAKGADHATLTQDEIAALLRAAAAAVPPDSSRSTPGESTAAKGDSAAAPDRSRPAAWRSAGPRSSGEDRTALLLYWKRD